MNDLQTDVCFGYIWEESINLIVMKRNLLILGVAVLFGVGMASCSKCQTCGDCPDGITLQDDAGNDVDEVEVCEDDADSKEDYDAGIAIIEGFGCTCN